VRSSPIIGGSCPRPTHRSIHKQVYTVYTEVADRRSYQSVCRACFFAELVNYIPHTSTKFHSRIIVNKERKVVDMAPKRQ